MYNNNYATILLDLISVSFLCWSKNVLPYLTWRKNVLGCVVPGEEPCLCDGTDVEMVVDDLSF